MCLHYHFHICMNDVDDLKVAVFLDGCQKWRAVIDLSIRLLCCLDMSLHGSVFHTYLHNKSVTLIWYRQRARNWQRTSGSSPGIWLPSAAANCLLYQFMTELIMGDTSTASPIVDELTSSLKFKNLIKQLLQETVGEQISNLNKLKKCNHWDRNWTTSRMKKNQPHIPMESLWFHRLSSVACIYRTHGWGARGPRFEIGTRHHDFCSSFHLVSFIILFFHSSFSSFPYENTVSWD